MWGSLTAKGPDTANIGSTFTPVDAGLEVGASGVELIWWLSEGTLRVAVDKDWELQMIRFSVPTGIDVRVGYLLNCEEEPTQCERISFAFPDRSVIFDGATFPVGPQDSDAWNEATGPMSFYGTLTWGFWLSLR